MLTPSIDKRLTFIHSDSMTPSPKWNVRLRVEEVKQRFFIVLAQPGANAHVAHDGADMRARTPPARVAARAVLLKDALALICG
jgi:hypothetical protein